MKFLTRWYHLSLSSLALALLAVVAGAAEPVPPGLLVDVGGYRLHIFCQGAGLPAVILDAGLGGSSRDWNRVRSGLGTANQLCIYDRAGYGASDAGPRPRTSGQIAAELHTLLERAGVPPPYVLVGHSFGGYNMRLYASRYPREAVGLVLIDSPHEAQLNDILKSQILRQIDPQGLLSTLWPQLLNDLAGADLGPVAAMLGMPGKTLQAILGELAAFERSSRELDSANLPPELPLVVIAHGRRVMPNGELGDRMEQRWLDLQRQLAERQRNGLFLIARDSAHNVPLDQPELVIEGIRHVMLYGRGWPITSDVQSRFQAGRSKH